MGKWSSQDARNRFSAVVDAALAGEPQQVTRKGKPVVVVVAIEEYERLCQAKKAAAPDLIEQPPATPEGGPAEEVAAPNFIEHLLAIPKGSDDDGFELPRRTRDYSIKFIDVDF